MTIFHPRRRDIVLTAIGTGTVAGIAIHQRHRIADALIPVARTSLDSRWYGYESGHAALLADVSAAGWAGLSAAEIGNRQLLDLRDVESLEQLRPIGTRRVLARSEPWEYSAENPHSIDPEDDVGYPTLVQAPHAGKAGAFHLFYAIHDPDSGIGLTIAHKPDGPYAKLAALAQRTDSRVLRAPPRPRLTSHFSSPQVLWNAEARRWHLYFHFYENRFAEGMGHQRTALATSTDLIDWTIMTGRDDGILAVLPTTAARWMNSQSSYHVIVRLPNGLWLAWLRGTGGEMQGDAFVADPTALGLAVSHDGVRWALVPGSPQLRPAISPVRGNGVIRPALLALSKHGPIACWAEAQNYDSNRYYVTARTDFRHFEVTPSPLSALPVVDGPIAAVRYGSRLDLFAGPMLHSFAIDI